jgi:hypothetical protein
MGFDDGVKRWNKGVIMVANGQLQADNSLLLLSIRTTGTS